MVSIKITSTLAAAATLFSGVVLATPVERAAQHSGKITFYSPSDGIGACGRFHNDSDMIVAVSPDLFDPQSPGGNPNRNSLCGRRAKVRFEGKTIAVTIADRCAACSRYDIDLSPAAFSRIAQPARGIVVGTWELL